MQHPSSLPMVLRGSFIFRILVTKKKGHILPPFTVKDKGSEYFGNFWCFCSDFDTLLVQNDNRFKAGYEHNVACSKRSDSGERCGVEKAMKSRGGLGREVREPSLTSPPPSLLLFRAPFYFAPLPTI